MENRPESDLSDWLCLADGQAIRARLPWIRHLPVTGYLSRQLRDFLKSRPLRFNRANGGSHDSTTDNGDGIAFHW